MRAMTSARYSLMQQAILIDRLGEQGITIPGAGEPHGAFIVISTPKAAAVAARLLEEEVVADAREGLLAGTPGGRWASGPRAAESLSPSA
jgi:hypothetical protein